MGRCLLVVFTNAAAGREEEYDTWYDTHLDHMLEVDGCVAAQRFRVLPNSDGPPPHEYLAVYEFETDDVRATKALVSARMGSDAMPESDAKTDLAGWYVEPVSDRRVAA